MGTITKSGSISAHATSHDATNYSYASVASNYPLSNAYTESSSTTYAQVNWTTGRNAETYVYLRFDLHEIPVGARILSVSASAKGYINTTSSSRVTSRQMQLASGTTLKGSALTLSTSTSARTFSDTGTWTRDELQSAGVRFYVKRGTSNTSSTYQLRMYGASITVEYEYDETTYSITVNNSTEVSVTASENEVLAGDSVEIRAESITNIVIKDNGVNVTNQFVQTQDEPESYAVENLSSTYGFALNSNGYYESNNAGHSNSYAVCKVSFHLPVPARITFTVINYAESTYDYGLLSEIDSELAQSSSADTNNVYWSGENNNSSSAQTVTYNRMEAGDHFICAKYFKDQYTDSGNDSFQFKVTITLLETPVYETFWAYTITNVSANHTITVVEAVVLYTKENGAWKSWTAAWKKVNGTWVKSSDFRVFESGVNYVKG